MTNSHTLCVNNALLEQFFYLPGAHFLSLDMSPTMTVDNKSNPVVWMSGWQIYPPFRYKRHYPICTILNPTTYETKVVIITTGMSCNRNLLTACDLWEVISVKNFDVGLPQTHRF